MQLPEGAPAQIPGVDAAEARQLVEDGHAVIVDVREPHEWVQARVPGSIHIPLMQVVDRAGELPKDKTLVLLCHSGARSFHAGRALAAIGFPDVLNLAGGILRWHQMGFPLEQGQ